ncbi:hypothetical protein [Microbacterium sp.]
MFIETESGVVVASRAQARAIVKQRLAGAHLVDELLADRRAAARREDAA